MEDDTIWIIYVWSSNLHIHASSLMKKPLDVDIYFLAKPL